MEEFCRFRLRYRELTGCRPPRAPSCVSACATLVSEFGEEKLFAALQKWVSLHELVEDLAEDTHRPGDFLLEDAREILCMPALQAGPRPDTPSIPHISPIDFGLRGPLATADHVSAAVFAQPGAAAGHFAQHATARATPPGGAPAPLAGGGETGGSRFPLFARELRKAGK